MTKKLVGNVATVFNGNGFLAINVIARLGASGSQIVIGYRDSRYNAEKRRVSGGLGQIYYSPYHLKDEKTLHEAMKHSNIVINTIGKETETRNFSLEDVHIEGPRRMARIARECGVQKFIHISALNASPNPTPIVLKNGSKFLKTKYYGELAVREEFPEAIIFRPSDIVGEQDDFINHFTGLQRTRFTRILAIWDYYDGVEKQPVWIKDLVSGIENAILDDSANGKTFQAVGPYRYDFYELIDYIRSHAGMSQKYDDCRISNLRWDFGMRIAMAITSRIQKYPFFPWERVERDSISDYVDPKLPTLRDLGVELTSIENHIPSLAYYRPRHLRVEIPFESAYKIDSPRRLNVV